MNSKIFHSIDLDTSSMTSLSKSIYAEHFDRIPANYFDTIEKEDLSIHLKLIQEFYLNTQFQINLVVKNLEWSLMIVSKYHPLIIPTLTGLTTIHGMDIQEGWGYVYENFNLRDSKKVWGNLEQKSEMELSIEDNNSNEVEIKNPSQQAQSLKLENKTFLLPQLLSIHLKGKLNFSAEIKEKFIHDFNHKLQLIENRESHEVLPYIHAQMEEVLRNNLNKDLTYFEPLKIDYTMKHGQSLFSIKGKSSAGFLFSVTQALYSRNVYISEMIINTVNEIAIDQISVTNDKGEAITSQSMIEQIKFSIALIKQFTHLIPHTSHYALARLQFEKLLERVFSEGINFHIINELNSPDFLSNIAVALGSGEYIWEDFFKSQAHLFLPTLRQIQNYKNGKSLQILQSEIANELSALETYEEKVAALNTYKDKELFRIDMVYLIHPNKTFVQFADELSYLAEAVINTTIHLVRQKLNQRYGQPQVSDKPCRFAAAGLGKLGGKELGYASDLELILIYEGQGTTDGPEKIPNRDYFQSFVIEVRKAIHAKKKGIFELDLRLRPHGEDGPLACSLQSWKDYYGPDGGALDYERQALIKLRPIYGEKKFLEEIQTIRDELVYGPNKINISEILKMREAQILELTQESELNAKYSRGGLCEIEYSVQLLQILHGLEFSDLRTPSTIPALEKLLEHRILKPSEFERLFFSYSFLRRLINALRMVRGHAKDLVLPPPHSPEFKALARRLNYLETSGKSASIQLESDIGEVFNSVHTFFKSKFTELKEPAWEKLSLTDLITSHSPKLKDIKEVLQKYGYINPLSSFQCLMQMYQNAEDKASFLAVIVLAQKYIQKSPFPDKVIINWSRFLEHKELNKTIFQQMLYHPRYVEVAVIIFGYGDFLSNILIQYPLLIHYISNHSSLQLEKFLPDYLEEGPKNIGSGLSIEETVHQIRLYYHREILRIGIRDIYLKQPLENITREISDLATATIQLIALQVFKRSNQEDLFQRQCIFALGKLGGRELNYSSDIDLVIVCDSNLNSEQITQLQKLNRELIKFLSENSTSGRLFRVDFNLRPYGRQGDLISKLSTFEKYFNEVADGWEIQAWMKSRVVVGNESLGRKAQEIILNLLEVPGVLEKIKSNMVEIRMLSLSHFEDDHLYWNVKQSPGGIRTVEFFVQDQQIQHCCLYPDLFHGNTLLAISRLRTYQILNADLCIVLKKSYEFLRRIEHALQLEGMLQKHHFPLDEFEQAKLAKRLGYEDKKNRSARTQLLSDYHEYTEQLLDISEQIFPGSTKFVKSPKLNTHPLT